MLSSVCATPDVQERAKLATVTRVVDLCVAQPRERRLRGRHRDLHEAGDEVRWLEGRLRSRGMAPTACTLDHDGGHHWSAQPVCVSVVRVPLQGRLPKEVVAVVAAAVAHQAHCQVAQHAVQHLIRAARSRARFDAARRMMARQQRVHALTSQHVESIPEVLALAKRIGAVRRTQRLALGSAWRGRRTVSVPALPRGRRHGFGSTRRPRHAAARVGTARFLGLAASWRVDRVVCPLASFVVPAARAASPNPLP